MLLLLLLFLRLLILPSELAGGPVLLPVSFLARGVTIRHGRTTRTVQ